MNKCLVCGVEIKAPNEICDECWDDYENDMSDVFIPFDDEDDTDDDDVIDEVGTVWSAEQAEIFRIWGANI